MRMTQVMASDVNENCYMRAAGTKATLKALKDETRVTDESALRPGLKQLLSSIGCIPFPEVANLYQQHLFDVPPDTKSLQVQGFSYQMQPCNPC